MNIGDYLGYQMFLYTISYCCPTLKLYGYATERGLKAAMRRKVK